MRGISSHLTRTCPFDGCTQLLPRERFACRKHWFSLSGLQRTKIHAAYADWLAGRINGNELGRRQQEVLDEAQGAGEEWWGDGNLRDRRPGC
jgi:hypothetical protein